MWNEMSYRLYIPRSMNERLLYEDDNKIIYNKYKKRLKDDQEIYMTENGENLDVE